MKKNSGWRMGSGISNTLACPSGIDQTVDLPYSRLSSGSVVCNYLVQGDDLGGPRSVKDSNTVGLAYDQYFQDIPSFTSGAASDFLGIGLGTETGEAISGLSISDPVVMDHLEALDSDLPPSGRGRRSGHQLDAIIRPNRETTSLPPDASSTLYVEGLPPGSTRREVAHVLRQFVGYKEVSLVSKESKHRGSDPLIFCFVDFTSLACAATALNALQGYKINEHDCDSAQRRLQFSQYLDPRSGSRSRGKRQISFKRGRPSRMKSCVLR